MKARKEAQLAPGAGFARSSPLSFKSSWKWIVAPALVLASCLPTSRGAEYGIGAGIVGTGLGAQVHFRPDHSHWRVGYEYGRMPAHTSDDPFTGRPLTREVESLTGPFVHYQFHPEAGRGWYLGLSVLRWSRSEESLTKGDSSTRATTDPYFGGGYLVRGGKHFYFNAAFFVAPGAKNKTETSTSSTENSGNFDLQLTLGFTP